jgi:hypothetical protein
MGVRFYCGGVITIFPKGTFASFPLIVFLACSSRDQLHALWDHLFPFIILYKKMKMV